MSILFKQTVQIVGYRFTVCTKFPTFITFNEFHVRKLTAMDIYGHVTVNMFCVIKDLI